MAEGARPPDPPVTGRLLAEARLPEPDDLFLAGLRRWVAGSMRGCTSGAIQEACIVLGELLANAFRHASGPYGVHVLSTEGAVRLRVEDTVPAPATPWAVGKGLLVVRGLCPVWGVEPCVAGKAVWADLPVLVAPLPD